jgi:hypothetical protein
MGLGFMVEGFRATYLKTNGISAFEMGPVVIPNRLNIG